MRQFLLALLGVAAIGAATVGQAKDQPPKDSVVVWEGEKSQWVRLEPRDERGAPPNEHPVQVSPSVLSAVLGTLSVTVDEETTPVFSAEESAELGDAISRALAQATRDQDVTFRTAGTNPTTGAFKFVRVNTGRVFEQGGKLNVIFGDVHATAKKKTIYGHTTDDFSKPRPASRTSSKKHEDWVLVLPPGAELQASRDDWVAFASSQLATVAARAPAPAATTGTAAQAQPAPSAAATAPAQPAASTAPAPSAAAPAPPASSASSPEADMERRLRKLKDLHDQGLITDEAYKAKVEEILSVL